MACSSIEWLQACVRVFMFLYKQKTAYEMRISDWSSDVCSSDLASIGQRIHFRRTLARGSRLADHHLGVAPPQFPHVIVEAHALEQLRSEERRVGKECVSTCRSRWSPYH